MNPTEREIEEASALTRALTRAEGATLNELSSMEEMDNQILAAAYRSEVARRVEAEKNANVPCEDCGFTPGMGA